MNSVYLLHHFIVSSAFHSPERIALSNKNEALDYAALERELQCFASGLMALGLERAERVAIYLDKRFETVTAAFGTSRAGGVFVPVNPVLKAEQVGYILRDCNVRVLVTSLERFMSLECELLLCHDLKHIVLTEMATLPPSFEGCARLHRWSDLMEAPFSDGHRIVDTDMASILYTSGSTGRPKGVVLSHRNMVTGAKSVAQYLGNVAEDTLLAALPLSFDAGFSQLTTAFCVGARVVLLNYLMPRDVLNVVVREQVSGLTAVPPLWIQLSKLQWPDTVTGHLRYIANTGGHMPFDTLSRLRAMLPRTRPYLMYGLTEAFRATYLPPEQVDLRPDSIGKAIPNTEVMVLREDGSECGTNEPGELVQRGPLVALGYWNDPEKTIERFKPLPAGAPGYQAGLVLNEIAVFSGDTVRRDEEGFLYFIGRRDEMIKTSGYRVSPTEVEEMIYAMKQVGECAAFGVEHPTLGQAIHLVVTPSEMDEVLDIETLFEACRKKLPAYMVPVHISVLQGPLPRNQNGKIDRQYLATYFSEQIRR